MKDTDYRNLSFWHESAPGSLDPRPPLASDEQVDVAIVGAGFSGLWTAYYLSELQPGIRIALVEAEIAGFGASGRNGGFAAGVLVGIDTLFDDPSLCDGAIRLQRAMFDSVDEIGRVCEHEGIDCHFAKGGSITVATVEVHRGRLRADLESLRALGFGEDDYRWLEPEECAARVRTSPNLGGLFLRHCAAIHPLRLARGLAERVESRGVKIYERSPARALEPRCVVTPGGRLRADVVVRATEAYTKGIPGHERALIPVHSMMIATEPLPESAWKEMGLANREGVSDPRRYVIYGQRTADDRLAFGTRGNYFYGSRIFDRFSADDPNFAIVQRNAEALFPVLRDFRTTHRWGGSMGISRNWQPKVGIDRAAGFAWIGGYAGTGVAASNLAGRTLAELIVERDSERTALPLVGPPFPNWEPEPMRWIGVTGVKKIGASLDRAELSGRPTPKLRNKLYKAFVLK